MLLIPAIDIKEGRCVRLRRGDLSDETLYDNDQLQDQEDRYDAKDVLPKMAGPWAEGSGHPCWGGPLGSLPLTPRLRVRSVMP